MQAPQVTWRLIRFIHPLVPKSNFFTGKNTIADVRITPTLQFE